MALFRKLFYRKPPDGLLEICERVFVFDSCFSTDVWQEENYKRYVAGVVGQLKDYSPDASFLAFNFREGVQQSQIAEVLSDCDMTVMEYPRQYEGTPLLTMELIHHYLRSGESWLSLGTQNLLLMHCERGGWPILAFMLAALLIYRKQYSGEQKTLDMIYRQAPRELLQLLSPLNPVPSQLRYLQYVSRRNLASEWPPLDRALTLDCVILRLIPNFDGEGGCCPMFRIYGQDPFLVPDRTPKVLFSTPKRGKTVRTYKQAECELVKIDINCHIQGDVVLECLSLDHDREREVMMFRVVFNTAFIRSNILMLIRDEIDMLWGVKDQFPKDFRAEVLFSEMDAVAAVVPVDFSGFDDKDGLPVEAFAKVHEIFSSVDWLDPKVASTIHDDGPHRRVISPTTHHDADSPRRRVLSPTTRHEADLPQSPQRRVITPFTRHGRDNIEESVVHSDNFKSATHGTELLHPPKDNLEKEAGQFNSQEAPRDDGKSNIKSQQINELPSDPGSKPLHRNDVPTENVVDTRKIALPVASLETLAEDRSRPSLPELPSSKQPTMTSSATKVSTPLPPSTLATAPLSETTSASETVTAVTPPPPSSSSRSQQDEGPTTSVTPSAATASSPLPPPPPPPPSISPQSVLDKGSTVSAATVPTTPPQPSSSPPNISDGTSPPPSPSNISSKAPSPPPPPPSVSSSAPPPPPPPPIVSSNAPPPPPPPPIVSSNGPSPPPSPPEVSSSAPPPPPPPIMSNSNQVPSAPPPPAQSAPAAPSAPPPPPGAGPAPPPPPGKGSTTGAPTPPPPSGSLSSGKGRLNKTIPSKNNQTKKLKPLHWLKLTRAVQGSLWAETQKSGDAKAPEIDIKELESLFSAAVPSSDHHGKSGSRGARGPKVEKVQLVDHRRAYNCEIMLSKVKVPLNELTSSVLNLEDTNLDIDQVENLIKFCPTKEEMELLKGYTGDREKLGKCEQFFLELMKVPRVESKLRVFSFKLQFSTQVSDLRKSLNTVNSAAEEIRDSAKLKRIMQTILSLGNALNHGTARGSAIGFRLDSLLKLTDTRARNNKMTLMHYLCKVLADKLPEVLDFSKDLAHLELSSKVQLKFLAEEMQSISKGLEKVVQELSSSENDGPISDTFCKKLKEFLCFAEGEVRSLASLYSGVGRNVDALIVYFGEDPVRCSFEQVVTTLLNFVRLFNKAHEENIKHQEREMKKAAENSQKSDTNSSHKGSESLLQTPVQSATI